MTLKRFDPEKRKILLALDKDSFDKACKSRETGEFLHDEAVQIIPLPLNGEHSSHPVLQQLVQSNLLTANMMLMEDPFRTGQYLQLDRFTEQTQLAKADLFALLCQKLGAKKVIFHVDQSSDNNKSAGANISMTGAAKKFVDPDVSAKRNISDSVRNKLTADYEYDGHQPTDEDFAEAEAFIQRHRLCSENSFRHILESRKQKNNPIKRKEVSFELTSETDKFLEVAKKFSLKIRINKPQGTDEPQVTNELMGIKSAIHLQSKKIQKLVIKTTVIFA